MCRSLFITGVFLIFLSSLIYARDLIIIVEDEDLQLPLEGAVITLRSGAQFFCNEDGLVQIDSFDNRQTVVTVSYPGYESLRLVVPAGQDNLQLTAGLRLGGILESKELVIEAASQETRETRRRRSVAITDRELTRTA